ncbi:MAG: Txe/YoeB family addiction module toxin [Chitinivibrionia bacterium]|nr:Txe/YoeB family addiction module toxin [Chitinivibrionia bacterium]
MKYIVLLDEKAKKDIAEHERSGNKAIVRKIESLLSELQIHPESGTGKPERLKFNKSGLWSRRISGEHRLIYAIEANIISIIVVSAKGHYE